MRRRQFAPAMRRRSHRIRIGRFATALSALVALAAPVLTQAQNAPRVGWIFSDASALNPPKLARFQGGLRELGYVEDRIGNNRADKISSAAGSGGKRCEMAPEEFAKFYPPLLDWISDHVGCQRTRGANRRLPRVFAATALFYRKDFDVDKSRFSRPVANATPIFHGASALCRF